MNTFAPKPPALPRAVNVVIINERGEYLLKRATRHPKEKWGILQTRSKDFESLTASVARIVFANTSVTPVGETINLADRTSNLYVVQILLNECHALNSFQRWFSADELSDEFLTEESIAAFNLIGHLSKQLAAA